MKKPSAIWISDLHARDDQPVCRSDNFIDTLIKKNIFIKDLCSKHKVPLGIAGDIFHKWKPSPFLIKELINSLPDFIAIPGNHDLQNHSMDLYDTSGLSVLEASGKCIVANKKHMRIIDPSKYWSNQNDWIIASFPFGIDVTAPRRTPKNKRLVCMLHELIIKSGEPSKFENVRSSSDVLDDHSEYDLIVTGDHHKNFTEGKDGRLLLNQGGVSRQSAARKDDKIKIFLWYAYDNSYEEIQIPTESDVITVEHLNEKKSKDSLIDNYIEAVKLSDDVGIDYKENMKQHIHNNNVEKEVSNIIWEGLSNG